VWLLQLLQNNTFTSMEEIRGHSTRKGLRLTDLPRMVKNLKPRIIHGRHIFPSGSTYPKEALWVGTLCRFLAGLLQSAVAQLSADPKIGTSFDFLDE
jgi:hypothetical protein